MKEIATALALIIVLVGYVPYIRDCIKGKTKPHMMSWFVWTLISFLAFGLQFFNGGGVASYINLVIGFICLIIFFFALKQGTKNITKIDIVAFVLAIFSTILWLVIKQPVLSIILVVIIDAFSFFPTIRKSWNKPWDETLVTFEFNSVKNVLSIYALQELSFVTVLFPLYALAANVFFCLLLIFRRRVVNKNGN